MFGRRFAALAENEFPMTEDESSLLGQQLVVWMDGLGGVRAGEGASDQQVGGRSARHF